MTEVLQLPELPGMILRFMKRIEEPLSSFDKSWRQFSQAWKKARAKASEKSVHDLRVSIRRLIARLELARVLSRRDNIGKLQRRFKKVLKSMGALRDVQVQLESVSQIRNMDVIAGFKRRLKRRERREIGKIHGELKRDRKQRLAEAFKDVRSEFNRLQDSMSDERFLRSVERFLSSRRNRFLKAKQRFQRLQPVNEEALHQMRIALKKLRYSMEAVQPILGPSASDRARQMQAFQKLMGDSRDVEILRAELAKWAEKKGNKIAVVPALDDLQIKREALLKRIIESSGKLERIFETDAPKPVTETTEVIQPPAAASDTASGTNRVRTAAAGSR
jgi:CHAD domain-containing protein